MSNQNIEAIYRLSPLQEGMLYHTLESAGRALYFEQYSCIYQGRMDTEKLEAAWASAAQRHGVLRTLFTWERRDQPLQIVRRRVQLPWRHLDWRGLSGEAQAAQWQSLLRLDRDRGFELERAPLLRLTLIRLDAERWRFLWSFHHLLLDGWSMRLILDEVMRLYQAALGGRASHLPGARPYADFITWLAGRDAGGDRAFWSGLLGDFEQPTLPTDPAARSGTQASAADLPAGMLATRLDAGSASRLKDFAAAERVTLNTLCVAAWALVLGRHCRSRDLVFGATVSGRPMDLEGADGIAGLFINTLPIRVSLPNQGSIGDWLRGIQSRQLGMREFEQTPLVEVQKASGVPPGTPLFESILVFENFPGRPADPGEPALSVSDESYIEYSNFPLAILVVPGADLELIAVHDRKRFGGAFVERILVHLKAALASIASPESTGPADLSIVPAAERRQLLETWNATARPFPQDRCIHQLIEDCARRHPEARALVDHDGALSYRGLDSRANRLAHELVAAGVRPGMGVAVFCERSAPAVTAILAILKAGGAYVPLDPAFPGERVRFVLEDLRTALRADYADPGLPLLLTQTALLDKLPRDDCRILCVDRDPAGNASPDPGPPLAAADPGQAAYVIYTSGTTGRPKGVMVSHRSLVNSTTARQDYYREPFTGYLLLSSLATDSSIAGLFWPLISGAALVLPRGRLEQDMERLLDLIAEQGVSHLLCVPSLYGLLLEQADPDRLAGLKLVIVAGEACPRRLVDQHRGLLPGVPLYNEYGPSEACVWATAARLDDAPGDSSPSIGRPIANTSIYLLDEEMQPVPVGVAGELCIGGEGVALGYLNQERLSAERFLPNPFRQTPDPRLYRTGDLARYTADGSIEFLGRADNQVKVRGYRVELEEIEQILATHPGVGEAAVLLQGEQDTARLAAYFTANGEQDPPLHELREFLGARLPDYMQPQSFAVLDELPRTTAGKLDRAALSAMRPRAAPQAEPAREQPRNQAEAILAQIWREVLGVSELGVNEDFFQLGGDSLLSIRILSRARQQGLQISPERFFSHPTIAGQAAGTGTAGPVKAETGLVTGPLPLTPIQLWFFERITEDPQQWNLSALYRVAEGMDHTLIERALQRILLHHDALRTRFHHADGEWRATIADPDALPPLLMLDLTESTPEAAEAEIRDLAARLHTGFDLQAGPLIRAALIRTAPPGPDRLLIVAHHLVIDTVSWQILTEDLETLCRQLQRGEGMALPAKTSSIRDWASRLQKQAASTETSQECEWWLHRAGSARFSLPLDFQAAPEENRFASAASVIRVLDRDETRALISEVPTAYHSQIMDALLAAFAGAISKWSGQDTIQLDIEGHGRQPLFEQIDVSRTVGWFTASQPVWLRVEPGEAPGDIIKRTKEALREIPHDGIGYGLLRYLSPDGNSAAALAALPDSQIIFNYLGQSPAQKGLFELEQFNLGPARSARGMRAYLLEVNARVVSERLHIDWSYSDRFHRRETVERLADALCEELRTLIAHCRSPEAGGHTPSDFPLADLDQEELDDLAQLLEQADGLDGAD